MAASVYESGKEFAYDHVSRDKVVTINRGTDKNKHKSQRTKKIDERHSITVCGAIHCGYKRFRKIHLSPT